MLLLIVLNLILHKTQIVGYKDGKSNLNKNGVKSLKDEKRSDTETRQQFLTQILLPKLTHFLSKHSFTFKFMIFIQVGFVHYCIRITSHDLAVALTSSNYSYFLIMIIFSFMH